MKRKSMVWLLVFTMLVGLLSAGCGDTIPAAESGHDTEYVGGFKDSVPEKEGYVLDFSTEFNDSALETSRRVVDVVDSGGTCLYSLLAARSHELPGPWIPHFQNSNSKSHLTGRYVN